MNDIIVAKFGGSSLADAHQFRKVKGIVEANNKRRYIIPSAPGRGGKEDVKVTDLLYLAHEQAKQHIHTGDTFAKIEARFQEICQKLKIDADLSKELVAIKEKVDLGASRDYAASRGEYMNGLILAKYLDFEFVDASELIVFKDNGRCDLRATEAKAKERLRLVRNAVIPGFYGANARGEVVTFSRGGSDVTGSIIANAVQANLYENWTDVSGFLMADPNIVPEAKTIEVVTYKELRELAYMGAPVLHDEVIFPLRKHSIPINLRNTNRPQDQGTMVVDEASNPPIQDTITGITGKKDFTVIMVDKIFMNSEVGFIRKLAEIFERYEVSIEHIPSSIDSISAIISSVNIAAKLEALIQAIREECEVDDILVHQDMALVTVVGRGLVGRKGISGKIFTALAENGINIRMLSQDSRELNIIIGVNNEDYNRTIKAIYSIHR